MSGLTPRTNNSSLGLGSVGGARGVGAGLTQVLVNFIVNYDRGRLAELSKDINAINATQIAAGQNLARVQQNHINLGAALLETEKARAKINASSSRVAENARKAVAAVVREEKANGVATRATLDTQRQTLQALVTRGTLTQREAGLIANFNGRLAEQVAYEREIAAIDAQIVSLEEQKLALLNEQRAVQGRAGAAAGRAGSLLLGLAGGVIGGALVGGLALGPLQAAMDAVSEGLQDMIDPARHAREELSDVGEAIDSLTDDGKLTRLQAAVQAIKDLGTAGENLGLSPEMLAAAASLAAFTEKAEAAAKAVDVQKHLTELYNQTVIKQAGALAAASAAEVVYEKAIIGVNTRSGDGRDALELYRQAAAGNGDALIGLAKNGSTWAQNLIIQAAAAVNAEGANKNLARSYEEAAQAAREAAAAAAEFRSELDSAAVDSAVHTRVSVLQNELDTVINQQRRNAEIFIDITRQQSERLIDGIQRRAEGRIDELQNRLKNLDTGPSQRTQGIQNRLDNLDDGPSKRTLALAAAIERLNKAQEKARFEEQLASIAEERHQILLRERLRLTKGQIDLDDFKGKDRLIAIDALLARQRQQNEAQDRFNKLLEIQYQIQQGVHRQQGETIQDFIARRAQYYRGLLQQAAELNREGPAAELEAERERVQASIDLKELEQKRRKLLDDRAREQHIKGLQDELRDSQEHDRNVLESRRESLQKQLEASRKADADALESRREALQKQIEAVRDNASAEIERINDVRDRTIAAREVARDGAIHAAQVATDAAIAAEEYRAAQIKRWASISESERLQQAFRGAQNIAELNRFAGNLAGANFSIAYIQAQLTALGVDPAAQAGILMNTARLRAIYLSQLVQLAARQASQTGVGGSPYGMAKGGVFMANNSNTPLGGDMRWGDGQGNELGVMLSNRVVQTLREQGGAGSQMVGDVTFVSEDPYRDRYKFERMVRGVVRDEYNH